jgi:hypothetical protein
MTKVRRRPSRADLAASQAGKTGTPGKDASRIEHVPELQARPTLSVATIRTDDVPTLLREPPRAQDEVGLLKVVSAIDGAKDVTALAKACHLEVEQVRALIASLVSRGFVSIPRAKAPSIPDAGADAEKAKGADYWLKGLKPRTR